MIRDGLEDRLQEEFDKLGIKSVGEIYDILILSRFYNLGSFGNVIDNIDIDMNHAERTSVYLNAIKENTCIISNRFNYTFSSSNSPWYIEQDEFSDEDFIVDSDKIKLWESKNNYYYNGDTEKLIDIILKQAVVPSKLNDGVNVLKTALGEISNTLRSVFGEY